MDKKTEEAIERLVDGWPALTEETKARLREILSGDPGDAEQEWIRRQLAQRPERSKEWTAETLRLWGLRQADPGESVPEEPSPLTDDDLEAIRRLVAEAPPLSPEQIRRIVELLRQQRPLWSSSSALPSPARSAGPPSRGAGRRTTADRTLRWCPRSRSARRGTCSRLRGPAGISLSA